MLYKWKYFISWATGTWLLLGNKVDYSWNRFSAQWPHSNCSNLKIKKWVTVNQHFPHVSRRREHESLRQTLFRFTSGPVHQSCSLWRSYEMRFDADGRETKGGEVWICLPSQEGHRKWPLDAHSLNLLSRDCCIRLLAKTKSPGCKHRACVGTQNNPVARLAPRAVWTCDISQSGAPQGARNPTLIIGCAGRQVWQLRWHDMFLYPRAPLGRVRIKCVHNHRTANINTSSIVALKKFSSTTWYFGSFKLFL